MCGTNDDQNGGNRTGTPYADRYPPTARGPIHRGGVSPGPTTPPKRRYLNWFAPVALPMAVLVCSGGSSPEQDLDDPGYDPFRISRRARGRRDGPWNSFAALAAVVLVVLGTRRVRSA